MLGIGVGGLLLVAMTLWLVVLSPVFVLVGTALVIIVAYLAAASSQSEQLLQSATRPRIQRPWLAADESWGPSSSAEWAAERAGLQRQVAMLEQRNAILTERLRRLQSERWQVPVDPVQFLADAQDGIRGVLQSR
jgi:hypothetical protein